jgi:Domain of unknown function (DUF222)/HNH endonuclease
MTRSEIDDPQHGDLIGAVAALSNEELTAGLDEAFKVKTAAEGRFLLYLGEAARRETFRDDGATSAESWTVERFGVSTPTARALTRVGEKACDLPYLMESLCAGDVSFDKVRAVVDVATPATDADLRDQARACTVRELAEVARSGAASPTRLSGRISRIRKYLRFNDALCTMSMQLPTDAYADTRARLVAKAKEVPSDGDTPWDERLCDGFLELILPSPPNSTSPPTTGSPYVVVAHVPLESLVDESGGETTLAGELEHVGLIDGGTLKRIACDATIAIGVDDDVGHTMYEGRARRFPTDTQRREVLRRDRHCRFPGCTNKTFTNVHHIVAWKPGGRTDLFNLVLLCKYHHGVVHRNGWTMSGNANEELIIVSPTGGVMTSRPSPLWTRATAGLRAGRAG